MLISQYCEHEEHEKIDLLNGAIALFREIDTNANGFVDWKEFLLYVKE